MKFKDHGDWLKVSLEDVGSIRFDETCQYGVSFDIKNEGLTAVFILTADEAIKFARGILKVAEKAR